MTTMHADQDSSFSFAAQSVRNLEDIKETATKLQGLVDGWMDLIVLANQERGFGPVRTMLSDLYCHLNDARGDILRELHEVEHAISERHRT